MAGSGGNPSPAPKILLAKPGLVTAGKFTRAGSGDDDSSTGRSRLPSIGSLNLLSDLWDFQLDRFLPFLTDNTEFTVVGVIGPPGVGKSTILNEIYGFDSSSPGMLPPVGVESEETRAMAKHFTVGIEPRISSERIILLDTQPVFSPSVLAEMIRPDGSSTISVVITGEPLSAELAHEMMSIQLGVLLASICHIIIVVTEGVRDASMWRLMLTVDLLKHGIPDPSSPSVFHQLSSSILTYDRENITKLLERGEEYIATPIFVHTRLGYRDATMSNYLQMKKALARSFSSSTFIRSEGHEASNETSSSAMASEAHCDTDTDLKLFFIPSKTNDDSSRPQYESYTSALSKLRDQVLSTSGRSFSRTVSERDWLKNSAKICELIKNSPVISDYCKMLQSSGLFRK